MRDIISLASRIVYLFFSNTCTTTLASNERPLTAFEWRLLLSLKLALDHVRLLKRIYLFITYHIVCCVRSWCFARQFITLPYRTLGRGHLKLVTLCTCTVRCINDIHAMHLGVKAPAFRIVGPCFRVYKCFQLVPNIAMANLFLRETFASEPLVFFANNIRQRGVICSEEMRETKSLRKLLIPSYLSQVTRVSRPLTLQ